MVGEEAVCVDGCEELRETTTGALKTVGVSIRTHEEWPWLIQKFFQAHRLKQENAFFLVVWAKKYSTLSLELLLKGHRPT